MGGAGAVVAHYVGPVSNVLVKASSFVPFGVGAALLGVVLLVCARQRILAAVAALIAVAAVYTQLPLFVADEPDVPGVAGEPITLMQANIRLGEGDVDAVVDRVRSSGAGILTVQELTDDAVVRLRAAGVDALLPYQYLAPKPDGGGGTGIYSRYPLRDEQTLRGYEMANLTARADLGDGRSISVAAVHPLPPYPSPAWMWAAEMGRLAGDLHDLAARGVPVLVGGDFNSTWSHSRYRSLLTDGYRDAADLAGAGLVPSYPTDTAFPPVVGIDHVVVRDMTIDSFDAVDLPGSDHRGLLVTATPHYRE
nr:endonuclease/exonuclease/phosphatase family protein [Rhodococcus sp. HNM0569]